MPQFFDASSGQKLAYVQRAGQGPGIVFLGGFKSDMTGTKAQYLDDWAQARGRSFLRFDYSGHGQSTGAFEDGAISDWMQDAYDIVSELTFGPQILVGSSMGGWLSLLLVRAARLDVAGLVTIAAAPDFTEDGFWAGFDDEQRTRLVRDGRVELPSDYDDMPYVVTKRLIEDGREHLVLRQSLSLNMPIRMLQGTLDQDVLPTTALRLLDHIEASDLQLSLVKGADHRFSAPNCLSLLSSTLDSLLAQLAAAA